MAREIRSAEDVYRMLDTCFGKDWEGFYADRAGPIPFFVDKPDENLVSWVSSGLIAPGRALDLGCGNGRNARYLASRGFEVDAVDLSSTAIEWARERSGGIRYQCADIFTADLGKYDFVYDSGCLHHIAPHRRVAYVELLDRVLLGGGHFGLTCFAAGHMGAEIPDAEFYRQGSLLGGIAFTPDDLRRLLADHVEIELRMMAGQAEDSPVFGLPVLLAALVRRPEWKQIDLPSGVSFPTRPGSVIDAVFSVEQPETPMPLTLGTLGDLLWLRIPQCRAVLAEKVVWEIESAAETGTFLYISAATIATDALWHPVLRPALDAHPAESDLVLACFQAIRDAYAMDDSPATDTRWGLEEYVLCNLGESPYREIVAELDPELARLIETV